MIKYLFLLISSLVCNSVFIASDSSHAEGTMTNELEHEFCTCSLDINNQTDNWALIAAGSSGYYNYRHQADICHAYHVILNGCIPQDNIIMMIYDDVAHDPQNPIQNNLVNQYNNINVYKNVRKDYVGMDVNPTNFVNALKGISIDGKKVLRSTLNSNVLIVYSDHGSTGFIVFPTGEYLYADHLNDALMYMYQHNMYNKLVFYLESCESGSMFNNMLPNNIDIYAITASSPTESSFACNPSLRKTYLSDCFSLNWMKNVQRSIYNKETLNDQFLIVKRQTTRSTVCRYGDMSIGNMLVSDFFTNNNQYNYRQESDSNEVILYELFFGPGALPFEVNTRYIDYWLSWYYGRDYDVYNDMMRYDVYFNKLVQIYKNYTFPSNDCYVDMPRINYDCYRQLVQNVTNYFGKVSSYGLQYFKYLAYECMF